MFRVNFYRFELLNILKMLSTIFTHNRILAVLFCLVCYAGTSQANETDTITIGVDPYLGKLFKISAHEKVSRTTIFSAYFHAAGLNSEQVKVNWYRNFDELNEALASGEIDASLVRNNSSMANTGSLSANLFTSQMLLITTKDSQWEEGSTDPKDYNLIFPSGWYLWQKNEKQQPPFTKAHWRHVYTLLRDLKPDDVLVMSEIITDNLPSTFLKQLAKLKINVSKHYGSVGYQLKFSPKSINKKQLVNGAIANFDQKLLPQILQRTLKESLYPEMRVARREANKVNLDQAELKWIEDNPIIRLATTNSIHSAPFDIVDYDGSYSGVAADYLKLIGEKTGLTFQYVGMFNFEQLAMGEVEKSWQLFSVIPRYATSHFSMATATDEYAYFSPMIITKKGRKVEFSHDQSNLVIAVHPNRAIGDYLKKYPNLQTKIFQNDKDALEAVVDGQADFTIWYSHLMKSSLYREYREQLVVSEVLSDFNSSIHFGVRNDLPELLNIMNKALADFTNEEHEQIREKWFSSNYSVRFDWQKALFQSWPYVTAIVALVFILLVWSRRLSSEVKSRKQAHSLLKKAKEEAEKANLAKSIFLSNMSHEIRTPMNGIIGMLELVQTSQVSEAQRHMLKTANESATSLIQIINDILDFSKIEAEKLELEVIAYSLGELIESVCESVDKAVREKGISFYISIEPRLYQYQTMGDPVRMRQVITNLLSNAVKFTSQGQISVIASLERQASSQEDLVLSIKDTGIGMDKKQISKLFSAFSQAETSTTRRFGGTGLGLAISQRLADLMGLSIKVRSEPGSGSVFSVAGPYQCGGQNFEYPRVSCFVINQNKSLGNLLSYYLSSWQVQLKQASTELPIEDLAEMAKGVEVVLINMEDATRYGLEFCELKRVLSSRVVFLTNDWSLGDDKVGINPLLPSQLRKSLFTVGEQTKEVKVDTLFNFTREEAEVNGMLILVVEDHPTNRLVIEKQLNKLNVHADFAENGEQALLSWQNKNYGMLLTDCHMPIKDGYELTRDIRRIEEGVVGIRKPIIALTASVLEYDKSKCIQAGMDEVLTKPVKLEALSSCIQEWLVKD